MEYRYAMKLPFSHGLRLLIVSLLSIAPVINFYVIGYIMQALRQDPRIKAPLPPLGPFKTTWLDGLVLFAIIIVHSLPSVLCLLLITLFTGPAATLLSLLVVITLTSFLYVAPAVASLYILRGTIVAAFNFTDLRATLFTKTYFLAWLVGMAWAYLLFLLATFLTVLTQPTILLPILASSIGLFAMMTTLLSLCVQAARTP